MLIWICGLSGAGKTTIGTALYNRLKPSVPSLVLLDGDELRNALGGNIGHDPESRRLNSLRIANLCHLLDRQGVDVICCAVTITPEVQKLNRDRLSTYHEVYLKVPIEILRKRDPKGLYRRADEGKMKNVAGVDIPYQEPADPHVAIDNSEDLCDVSPIVDCIQNSLADINDWPRGIAAARN